MQVLFMFDVRTVALLIAMTFLVQATAIGAQAFLIKEMKQYQGVGAALAANVCMALGLIIRLFVDSLPDFADTILASLLLLMGPGLFYVALGQFTGLGYSKVFVSGVIAIVLFLLVYFTYWASRPELRMVILSAGVVTLIALLMVQLWRIRQTLLRFSANLMLITFLIYGLFLVVRTVSITLFPPGDTFSNTPLQSATYLLSFFTSFFWSTGFILMVSQRLRNDLMEVATIDILTRIPNRRAMQIFLERELSRVQRNQGEFSLLLIDIDNFKQVNDRWGHAMGDAVLVKTAAVFQAVLRKQDIVARWGGEEFLVIVPGSPYCDPEALAERLRSSVADTYYRYATDSFHITISIGVACADGTSTLDELLKKADNALYRAKRTKNIVKVADGED